jgi:hypothetical protein
MNDVTRRTSLRLTAGAGLAALTGTAAAQNAPADQPQDRWRAWAITEGKETKLVVEGIVSEGGPGIVATVKPAEPQGINPKVLILKMTKASLPGIWAALLTPIPACYTEVPYRNGKYSSIEIQYGDGGAIIINSIINAEAGPN